MNKKAKKPKVSVLCLTYNQSSFVKNMLDSILTQKTNFSFEILIHDDASNDGTVEILKHYQNKYPNIIRVFFEKENQYQKGLRGMVAKILLPEARGEYVALCEGDDFFTNKNKLQLQVDFLDKHQDYALCFHPVKVFFENKEMPDHIFPNKEEHREFNLKGLLKENFIQTNSVLYRKRKKYDLSSENFLPGDWYLHLYHAQFGKIGFINKNMACYRRHSGSMWWNSYKNINDLMLNSGIDHLKFFFEINALYAKNHEYKKIILENFLKILNIYIEAKENKINQINCQAKVIELEKDLHKIQSSKVFKIWQKYCDVMKYLKLKK